MSVSDPQPAEVPCFVCAKTLDRVFDNEMQPYGGVMCTSHGNYGSRIFDPMFADSEWLQFIICDECLLENAHRMRQATKISDPKVEYQRWEPTPPKTTL